jgi:hypothetical protein
MKRGKRKAEKKGKAIYAIITRSLVSESGKFLPQPRGAALLSKCKISDGGPFCATEYAPQDQLELIKEHREALDALEDYARFDKDEVLLELVQTFKNELEQEYILQARQKARDDAARLKDSYHDLDEPVFVCGDLAALDVTRLEPDDARTLALLLKKWNRGAKQVYSRRDGRRSLKAHCVQLNHPFIETLPFYDDLKRMYQKGEYEEIRR